MSKNTKYLLVSLPASISRTNDHDEALTALRSAVTTDYGTVFPFSIPEFKIGTLDALVHQADELAKLEAGCEGVVGKVGDSLKQILEGDESKISKHKTVNDSQSGTHMMYNWRAGADLEGQSLRSSTSSRFIGTRSNTGRTNHWARL